MNPLRHKSNRDAWVAEAVLHGWAAPESDWVTAARERAAELEEERAGRGAEVVALEEALYELAELDCAMAERDAERNAAELEERGEPDWERLERERAALVALEEQEQADWEREQAYERAAKRAEQEMLDSALLEQPALVQAEAEEVERIAKHARIQTPPGFKLLAIAEFFFAPKTYTNVFEPAVGDLQDEYAEALAEDRLWKASYVRIRGYCSFWSAVSAQVSNSLVKLLLKAIGVATSNPS